MKRVRILLQNWEYYPWQVVYLPVYIYYLFCVLRTGRFFYFGQVNSNMRNAGFFGNTKTEMYASLPSSSYPNTLLLTPTMTMAQIRERILNIGFQYPLIVKPNIGERGEQLEKLDTEQDLIQYRNTYSFDCILQPFIDYDFECSIFCYRLQSSNPIIITSVVGKKFLQVIGDGQSTLETLIDKDDRAYLQKESLSKKWHAAFKEIIPKDKIIILRPNANHSKGASFYDLKEANDGALQQVVDGWCQQMKGFRYGRFDIRCQSIDDLKANQHYKIIEVNGIGAEPIDMYIPGTSVWKSWKILIFHWRKMYLISRINEQPAAKHFSDKEGWRELFAYRKFKREIAQKLVDSST